MSETLKKPVLETKHLGISFGGLHAVQDFNLSICSGELVGLIGPNGAGKTTTLHTISGLLRASSGSVTLDGKDLQAVPANTIIRLGLSHVPEGRHVFAQMTVEENLKMGAYTISDTRRVAENMERVYGHFPRLKERRRQLAGTLSGGEQQMLATGRALMTNPRIVLMDEPSMGLSPIFVNEIFDIIQQIIFKNSRTLKVKEPADNIRLLVDILAVADEFDHLTAMNINKPPISEIAAMGRLKKDKATYNPLVLSALAECIHILPTGACVDLSDGEKALVLAENPADFLHPMVLKFSTNMIYDLSDPVINKSLKITDIMKTMDNRIALDKDSVKHFVSDAYIKETADRFRKVKLQIAQHNQSKLEQKAASALMSSASVIPQDALGTEKPLAQKKPRKKMKLR